MDGNSRRVGRSVTGDPDVRILEIAADKLWIKTQVKWQGLWDDVPMNAFAMFTSEEQKLLWNRSRASRVAVLDVDKYRRLPKGTVDEVQVTSKREAEEAIKEIVRTDRDGISVVWLDYKKYHAVTIVDIDLDKQTFTYVDPVKNSANVMKGRLLNLFNGLSSGIYALNLVEID